MNQAQRAYVRKLALEALDIAPVVMNSALKAIGKDPVLADGHVAGSRPTPDHIVDGMISWLERLASEPNAGSSSQNLFRDRSKFLNFVLAFKLPENRPPGDEGVQKRLSLNEVGRLVAFLSAASVYPTAGLVRSNSYERIPGHGRLSKVRSSHELGCMVLVARALDQAILLAADEDLMREIRESKIKSSMDMVLPIATPLADVSGAVKKSLRAIENRGLVDSALICNEDAPVTEDELDRIAYFLYTRGANEATLAEGKTPVVHLDALNSAGNVNLFGDLSESELLGLDRLGERIAAHISIRSGGLGSSSEASSDMHDGVSGFVVRLCQALSEVVMSWGHVVTALPATMDNTQSLSKDKTMDNNSKNGNSGGVNISASGHVSINLSNVDARASTIRGQLVERQSEQIMGALKSAATVAPAQPTKDENTLISAINSLVARIEELKRGVPSTSSWDTAAEEIKQLAEVGESLSKVSGWIATAYNYLRPWAVQISTLIP